jgi:hypothetical protein
MTRTTLLRLATLLITLASATGCRPAQTDGGTTTVGVPGLANEHVSAATDGDELVVLAWSASSDATGTNIFSAVSTDGGASFSPPVRVNAVERQANVNGEQPPRVAVVREPDGRRAIVVLWTAKGPDGTALLSARSGDGGRSFGATTPLPGVDAPGNRGWESLAAGGDGQLFAVWLDHRDTASPGSSHAAHHQHGATASRAGDGVERAQRSQLFVSSLDGSLEPRGIARGVCYCCKTAVTTGPDGTVYAAWRHVYEGNRRDIAFTMSRDAGRSFDPPVRVSEDNWQLDGCPENGPALAIDGAGRIHVTWPTLVEGAGGETLKLFHASSLDGRTFTPRTELPTSGAASHPQLIVTPDDALIVAWDEQRSGERHVAAALAERAADGRLAFSRLTVGGGETTGAYPALAATASHAVVAWPRRRPDSKTIIVQRIAY